VLGRLTLAESALNSNVKLAAYRYDALGRLAMQVTYDYTHDPNDPNDPNDDDLYAASNVTKYYYYDTPAGGDGASSPVLPQVVEIKDGDGDTTDQFVWGPAYVDELLLHERDADGDPNNVLEQRLYAAHDTLYSVLRLIDEDGNVVEQYSYSPYGADPTDPRKGAARITDGDEKELTPDDSVAQVLYTGRQFDKAVGLNYHRARRLSHNLGRWTRRDPLGTVPRFVWWPGRGPVVLVTPDCHLQFGDGPSTYQLAAGNPMIALDPSGEELIITTITVTLACVNAVKAAYCCHAAAKCNFDAARQARYWMRRWDELLDQIIKEDGGMSNRFFRAKDRMKDSMKNSDFGSECAELWACCGVSGIRTIFWVGGRYLILKSVVHVKVP